MPFLRSSGGRCCGGGLAVVGGRHADRQLRAAASGRSAGRTRRPSTMETAEPLLSAHCPSCAFSCVPSVSIIAWWLLLVGLDGVEHLAPRRSRPNRTPPGQVVADAVGLVLLRAVWSGSTITLERKWIRSLVAPAWLPARPSCCRPRPPTWPRSTTKSCAHAARPAAASGCSGALAAKWPSRTWPSSWARTKATSSSDCAWSSRPNATTIEPSGSE